MNPGSRASDSRQPNPHPSGPHPSGRARFSAASLLAVAVGGFLGAGARIGAALLWPEDPGFPATMLLVNVLGSAGLGACSAWWADRHGIPAWVRAGIGTGFFGAFTTFSTVIFFTLGAPWSTALLYTLLSLLLCAGAAWAAMRLVELYASPRGTPPTTPTTPTTPSLPTPHGPRDQP